MNVIGLMSGTSADGVDAALVQIRGRGASLTVRQVAFHSLPYPPTLRKRILSASMGGTVFDICHLNVVMGEWFARAALRVIRQASLKPSSIHLIGSHGQTVHHLPTPRREPGLGMVRSTLQIAEPAVIAERTGITTVADFRPRDIAAGGEGAPLTPYAHYVLLRHPRRSRLIVNLGGITNVTYLARRGSPESVRAFDTGPGNMLLDGVIQKLSRGQRLMDQDGRLATKGRVNPWLLQELLSHPYLTRKPPKTTGREEFGEAFLGKLLASKRARRLSPRDLMATCSLFTAVAVGIARSWIPGTIDEVLVGGGGVRNRALMVNLKAVFRPTPVRTFDEVGWQSKAFESIAFAVLAYQAIHGVGTNIPAATGAGHRAVLGKIVPGGAKRSFIPR
ncbi:MAG: anhydro-N-acetylmuramic acid kinase [Nitrospiraceae bacterium]